MKIREEFYPKNLIIVQFVLETSICEKFWCKLHCAIRFDIYFYCITLCNKIWYFISKKLIEHGSNVWNCNDNISWCFIMVLGILDLVTKFDYNCEHIFLLIWCIALAYQSKMLMQLTIGQISIFSETKLGVMANR